MNEEIKPENMRIHSRADELIACLEGEISSLRNIISECATACGAAVSVECSLEFMAMLPKEIALKAKPSGVVRHVDDSDKEASK